MSQKGLGNLMTFTIIYLFLICPIFEGLISLLNNSVILNNIDEYSLLKEKTSEDITIWEDYLIYSVIFNQNNDIIEE